MVSTVLIEVRNTTNEEGVNNRLSPSEKKSPTRPPRFLRSFSAANLSGLASCSAGHYCFFARFAGTIIGKQRCTRPVQNLRIGICYVASDDDAHLCWGSH